jgi:hypothetical protein
VRSKNADSGFGGVFLLSMQYSNVVKVLQVSMVRKNVSLSTSSSYGLALNGGAL